MTGLAAVLFGALIGLSLGALGGGGSLLAVPTLVYVLGEPARAATTESLVIVGVAALAAAVSHARAGHVRWLAGAGFGVIGGFASYAGTALNRLVDPRVQLLTFAALIVVAALALLRRGEGSASEPVTASASLTSRGPSGVTRVLVAAVAVGVLTGFFGVGGGFVILPALVLTLGFSLPAAVGTSLLVIAVNSGSALLARAGHESFHWAVILPFTGAAILGSLAGRRVTANVSPATLARSFAGLLLAVAAFVATQSAFALVG